MLGAGRPAARRGEHPPACFRTGGVPTVWVPLCPGSRQTPGGGHCPSTRRVWCVGTWRPRPRGGRHAVLGRWVHAVWRDLPRHPQPPPAPRGPHWFHPLPGWGGLEAGELPLPGKATSDPAGEPQIGLDERRCVQRSVARGLRLLAAPPGSAGLPGRRVCEAFALVTKMRWRWMSRPRARPLQGTRGSSRWRPRPSAHEVTGPTEQEAHRRTASRESLYSPSRPHRPVSGCKGQGRGHALGRWGHLETQGTTWKPGDVETETGPPGARRARRARVLTAAGQSARPASGSARGPLRALALAWSAVPERGENGPPASRRPSRDSSHRPQSSHKPWAPREKRKWAFKDSTCLEKSQTAVLTTGVFFLLSFRLGAGGRAQRPPALAQTRGQDTPSREGGTGLFVETHVLECQPALLRPGAEACSREPPWEHAQLPSLQGPPALGRKLGRAPGWGDGATGHSAIGPGPAPRHLESQGLRPPSARRPPPNSTHPATGDHAPSTKGEARSSGTRWRPPARPGQRSPLRLGLCGVRVAWRPSVVTARVRLLEAPPPARAVSQPSPGCSRQCGAGSPVPLQGTRDGTCV